MQDEGYIGLYYQGVSYLPRIHTTPCRFYSFFFSIDFNLIENEPSGILLFLNGVPQEKMSQIEKNLREKLKDLADFHFLHSGTHSTKTYKLVNCNCAIRFSIEKEKI